MSEKPLSVAMDINVQIKGGVTAEPLPKRKFDLTREAVNAAMKVGTASKRGAGDYNPLPSTNPIIQAVGSGKSLDLRAYNTHEWNSQTRTREPVPFNEQKCYGGSKESLFLNTVHDCFSNHYPLGIRPEALMFMVVHEIGVTVKQNAEFYRHLFTTSKEKQVIHVQVDSLQLDNLDQKADWMLAIQLLHAGLSERMPSNLIDKLLPQISTHDVNSETASMVAVLDAASPFYSYVCSTCCGIPAIRLFGCAQDYDNLVTACTSLSETFSTHLSEYFKFLLPVLQEIADTASGRKPADNDFWSSIYNHYSGSGTDDADGWITAFVNYTCTGGKYVPKHKDLYDWKGNLKNNAGRWGSGIKRSTLPNHVSCVPFVWDYYGTPYDCRLMGGFLAIEDNDGYATPTLTWAVVRGDVAGKTVNNNGTVTVTAEGQDAVTF